MKVQLIIINVVFVLVDAYLTVTGYFDFNLIFHNHIMALFLGHSDGYLGLFWLICLLHDVVILNAIILAFYILKKRVERG
jgi:hypothetical protein